ncbi:MAG TPA: hypothetical protein VHV08_15845, partial [Pirellulales bacterium]|nr:hypothetical protein [Pirellulales bacterium]
RLQELVSEAQYHFDPLNYRHSLLRAFQGYEQSGLLTTPVYKYFRLAVDPHSAAHVALAFEGGDPAIVEEKIGAGRSIVVATEGSFSSLDPATKNPWTTMPAWPSFVPLVQELLSLAVRGQMSQHNALVGQPLGDALDAAATRATVSVTNPAGAREEVRMALESEDSHWSYADTSTSGVYHVELGPPVARRELFAVNVDTAESDLSRLEPEDLPKEFTTHRRASLEEMDAGSTSHHGGLHKTLLYMALGLLLIETFLAWRFGHATP